MLASCFPQGLVEGNSPEAWANTALDIVETAPSVVLNDEFTLDALVIKTCPSTGNYLIHHDNH